MLNRAFYEKYLLWPSIGSEYADVNGDDGNDDTKEGNGREFADEFHSKEHPEEHDEEKDGAVEPIVVELDALVDDISPQCHRRCDVQLKGNER